MKLSGASLVGPPGGTGLRLRPGNTLRKYFNIFRVSLIERLTYRFDFLFSTCLRFLPMITTILLWTAIYEGADQVQGSANVSLSGFNLREMVAYLLLVHISRMFSSMVRDNAWASSVINTTSLPRAASSSRYPLSRSRKASLSPLGLGMPSSIRISRNN